MFSHIPSNSCLKQYGFVSYERETSVYVSAGNIVNVWYSFTDQHVLRVCDILNFPLFNC